MRERGLRPLEDLLKDAVAMIGLSQRQSRGLLQLFSRRYGGTAVYVPCINSATFEDAVELACRLLEDGMTRPEIREALMTRTRCGRSKAYRLIRLALARRFERRRTKAPADPRSASLRASGASSGHSRGAR